MGTCNWIRAFNNVKKYKLFQLRWTSTCQPFVNQAKRRRQDDLLRLRLQLHKYKAYAEHLRTPKPSSHFSAATAGSQVAMKASVQQQQ